MLVFGNQTDLQRVQLLSSHFIKDIKCIVTTMLDKAIYILVVLNVSFSMLAILLSVVSNDSQKSLNPSDVAAVLQLTHFSST